MRNTKLLPGYSYPFKSNSIFSCSSEEGIMESILAEVGENKVLLDNTELDLSYSTDSFISAEIDIENLGTLYGFGFEFIAEGKER